MDWLEQWFGLNPDGGSGSIEASILAIVAALGVVAATMLHPAGWRLVRRLLRLARFCHSESP